MGPSKKTGTPRFKIPPATARVRLLFVSAPADTVGNGNPKKISGCLKTLG